MKKIIFCIVSILTVIFLLSPASVSASSDIQYTNLKILDPRAPAPVIKNSYFALIQSPLYASKAMFIVSHTQKYFGFLLNEPQLHDMAHVTAHFYAAIKDTEGGGYWDGTKNTGVVNRYSYPGVSVFEVSQLPIPWAKITGKAGSYFDNVLTLQYEITNIDSIPHRFRFGVLALTQGLNSSQQYIYDAVTDTINIAGTNMIEGDHINQYPAYLSMKTLNHPSFSHSIGQPNLDFSTGSFDGNSNTIPSTSTNYYSSLGTDMITIQPNSSVTITTVVGFDLSTPESAKTKSVSIPQTHTMNDIVNQWSRIITTFPPSPNGLTTDSQKKAWNLSWYTLKVNERWDIPGTYWGSPTHFRKTWYWDTAMDAFAASIDSNSTMDKTSIEYMLDTRMDQNTGYIYIEDGQLGYTQPPMIARAAWLYYKKSSDTDWAKSYYPKLKLQYQWWLTNRKHPTLHLFTVSRGQEAGLDNLPIFQDPKPDGVVEVSAILYDYAVQMKKFAQLVQPHDASFWDNEINSIKRDAQTMWNEQDKWFYSIVGTTQKRIKTLEPFFVIWANLASQTQVNAMESVIQEQFIGPYGTRSVAKDEPSYNPSNYTSGGDFQGFPSLLAEGLVQYGKSDMAKEILTREVANMDRYGDNLEVVNPDTGEPGINYEQTRTASPFTDFNASAFLRALYVVYGTPGQSDINADGKIDIFDYNILITNFGQTNCGNPADIDGNCKVDIFDYNILVTNFGK